MSEYTVIFIKSAQRDVRRIPSAALNRIRNAINMLQEKPIPSGSKKVRGYEVIYRVRVGQYRIVYEVAKAIRIITIIRIGHRKDVYKKL